MKKSFTTIIVTINNKVVDNLVDRLANGTLFSYNGYVKRCLIRERVLCCISVSVKISNNI